MNLELEKKQQNELNLMKTNFAKQSKKWGKKRQKDELEDEDNHF